jgi:ectoine hydroxylase-related dioxygenase (phytanoyl-CoA dioxygenase family)
MTSRERIIQFVEYKNISKNKFYRETGLSNGFLDKNNHPGADKLEQIIYAYPEINPEWLITGRGEMLKKTTEGIVNGSGVVIRGKNKNTSIDNRHYYSDSPDVLRAQVEKMDDILREKDDYITELKETIRELKNK